jgi:hypothetical protein
MFSGMPHTQSDIDDKSGSPTWKRQANGPPIIVPKSPLFVGRGDDAPQSYTSDCSELTSPVSQPSLRKRSRILHDCFRFELGRNTAFGRPNIAKLARFRIRCLAARHCRHYEKGNTSFMLSSLSLCASAPIAKK